MRRKAKSKSSSSGIRCFRRGKSMFSAQTGKKIKKSSCGPVVKIPSKYKK